MDRLTLVNDDVVQAYESEDPSTDPDELFNRTWGAAVWTKPCAWRMKSRGGARHRQVAVFRLY